MSKRSERTIMAVPKAPGRTGTGASNCAQWNTVRR